MPAQKEREEAIEFHPLTPERWRDFERLFGPRGACAGRWCMWFASTFLRLGFVEVARRSPTQPILRRRLRAAGSARARHRPHAGRAGA